MTITAAAFVIGSGLGLYAGYYMAWLMYAPKKQPEPETYNVPDPRIRELNEKIEAARAKHKPVKHLQKMRTQIAHEGLMQ